MQPQRIEIRFSATHAGFAQGFARLRVALDAEHLQGPSRYNAELVFEEIVDNIISHGATDGRELRVNVTLESLSDAIVLKFEDDGMPFDPRGRPDPEPPKSLAEAKIGGFGLMLMRRAASSIDYMRTSAGINRVTIRVARVSAG